MTDPRFPERDLKGFRILGRPGTGHVNLVYHIEAPDGTRWYSKVFVDLLHPNLKVYDGAMREVLAYRLGRRLSVTVPEVFTWGQYDFGVISRDAGDPLLVNPDDPNSAPELTEREMRDLAEILVFSHWIRDHERSTEHLVRSDGRVWSFDYQNCGPGGASHPENVLQPWLMKKICVDHISFDDVIRLGHFSGMSYPNRVIRQGAVALQRLIRDYYGRILNHEAWFLELAERIAVMPDEEIREDFAGLKFYQRGGLKVEVDSVFQRQLIEGKSQLPDVIRRWITFAKTEEDEGAQ